MNRIESKVAAAQRRLILGRFGRALCYTLFAALIVATIAIVLPALRVMDINFQNWIYVWVGGSTLAAVLAAAMYAVITAPSKAVVAEEVDRRFGLRERLSSSITLADDQRESDFGAALMSDAEKRADQLAVADRFALKPSKLGWLPISIIPVLAIVLLLAEPMSESSASSATKTDAAATKQVQTVAKQLKKRVQQQRRKAEAEGLKEATEMYEKMEAELDKISKREKMDRKDAMIAMNDLKKKLEERRQQLGSSEQMRKAMSQMKGLDAGPGEKVAKSIEKGNFDKAKSLVKDLADQMRSGKLSDKEKEQLKKQINQMKDALKQAAEQHEQKKQELQEKIDKARKEGRGNDAAKMQQQMNELQQKDEQMQKMAQMAEAINAAAKAMENGESGEAADALEQMAEELGEMADEMSELEDLESAMDQLSQSKEQMRCKQCQGAGCQACQGNGFGSGDGEGFGLGRGSGAGDRPESEDDTNTYETQVRGKVKKGKAIISGFADGPNRKGVTREDVKAAIESAISEESDPSENQTLPRTEREHTQQYFNQLREGE
jgi:flagellar biosynthesis/type III secretory pathway protein FliH